MSDIRPEIKKAKAIKGCSSGSLASQKRKALLMENHNVSPM